ncbi:MAG: UDP-3-O-(3-hydroxymyristoyl)glucosamine N-acyltransferase [Pseudolabrys sp.]|nr:UDP-3-O-(3-hydroxymyristoyl)glucosamine N-acyltransferase [Pseudolabrys sp.]
MASHQNQIKTVRAKDVAEALSAKLEGDGAAELRRVVHPKDARGADDLALAISAEAAAALENTQAAVVIVAAKTLPANKFKAVITVEPSRNALAILTALFDRGVSQAPGVHATAVVAGDAHIDPSASVGPYAVIGARSRVGAHASIGDHVSVGADVEIGPSVRIYPGARIGDDVKIGARSLVYHNAVVGSDGFSFAPELVNKTAYPAGTKLSKIHSLGNVVIGEDVEIGAATTIDRATLQTTRIGSGTKIDNQVQIAHNVTIGEGCIIAGACGISGSVKIGDRVRIGGGAGIANHVTIGNEAIIAAGSGLAMNVPEGAYFSGFPALKHERTADNFTFLMRHKALYRALEELVSRVDVLESRNPGAKKDTKKEN